MRHFSMKRALLSVAAVALCWVSPGCLADEVRFTIDPFTVNGVAPPTVWFVRTPMAADNRRLFQAAWADSNGVTRIANCREGFPCDCEPGHQIIGYENGNPSPAYPEFLGLDVASTAVSFPNGNEVVCTDDQAIRQVLADWDGNGEVTVQDLWSFLQDLLGGLTSVDLFEFLRFFFN